MLKVLTVGPRDEYELLDSGDGEKLERYGQFVLSRPDPQALWRRSLSAEDWKNVDAYFYRTGEKTGWKVTGDMPKEWAIGLEGLKIHNIFLIHPNPCSDKR